MSTLKAALKLAKTAIQEKQYSTALYNAELALRHDPDNYHGHVFMALSHFNLDQFSESEEMYLKAIKLNADDMLAYQGLLSLYESRGHKKGLVETWQMLRKLALKNEDISKYVDYSLKCARELTQSGLFAEATLIWQELYQKHDQVTAGTGSDALSLKEILMNLLNCEESVLQMEIDKRVKEQRFRINLISQLPQMITQTESEVVKASPTPLEFFYDQLLTLFEQQDPENLIDEYRLKYFKYLSRKLLILDGIENKRAVRAVMQNLASHLSQHSCLDQMLIKFRIESQDLYRIKNITIGDVSTKEMNTDYVFIIETCKEYTEKGEVDESRLSRLQKDILKKHELSQSRLANMLLIEVLISAKDWNGALQACINARKVLHDRFDNECLLIVNTLMRLDYMESLALSETGIEESGKAVTLLGSLLDQVEAKPLGEKDYMDAILLYSTCLQKTSRNAESLEVLKSFEERFIENVDFKIAIGWANHLCGDYESALKYYKDIENEVKNASSESRPRTDINFNLGKLYWDMGGEFRSEKKYAHTYLLIAAKSNPDDSRPFHYLGVFYRGIVNDLSRATRCFLKSLELGFDKDGSTTRALFDIYCSQGQYEEAASMCISFLEELAVMPDVDSGRRKELTLWSSKFLARYFLTTKEYDSAVFYAQSVLKTGSEDFDCLASLGDGYVGLGRFQSALKAFSRAKSFCDDSKMKAYVLFKTGCVNVSLEEYVQAINDFDECFSIVSSEPDADIFPVLYEMLMCKVQYSRDRREKGFFAVAYELCEAALRMLLKNGFLKQFEMKHSAWKLLYDIGIELLNYRKYHAELERNYQEEFKGLMTDAPDWNLSCVILYAIEKAIELCPTHAAYLSEQAWILHILHQGEKAVEVASKAVAMNQSNSSYWNVLGSCALETDPALSQHAFIMAIQVNSPEFNIAISWTNLAMLYVKHKDNLLALDCLRQAQTVDPEYQPAWFAQVILKHYEGQDVGQILYHALSLSCSNGEMNVFYSDYVLTAGETQKKTRHDLLQVLFLLEKANDLGKCGSKGYTNMGFIFENFKCHDRAVKCYEQAVNRAQTEEERVAATENLCRSYFRIREYQKSVDAYALITESEHGIEGKLVQALNHYFLDDPQTSINVFDDILKMKPSDANDETLIKNARMSLAQVLIGIGNEDTLAAAQEQLLSCFKEDPSFTPALSIIMAMGLANQNLEICQYLLQECQGVEIKDDDAEFHKLKVLYFLQKGDLRSAKSCITRFIRTYPSNINGWTVLMNQVLAYERNTVDTVTVKSVNHIIHHLKAIDNIRQNVDESDIYEEILLERSQSNVEDLRRAKLAIMKRMHMNPRNVNYRIQLLLIERAEMRHSNDFSRSCDLINAVDKYREFHADSLSAEQNVKFGILACEIAMDANAEDLADRLTSLDNILTEFGDRLSDECKQAGYMTMSKCLFKLPGMQSQALETVKLVAGAYPTSWKVQKECALVFHSFGEVEEALRGIDSAIAMANETRQHRKIRECLHTIRAMMYLNEKGRESEAADSINLVLQLNNQNQIVRYLQGILLVKQSSLKKACKILQSLRDDFPAKSHWLSLATAG